MAGFQNFRTALNGFHREDVARYLEYLNSKHQNQVNQLNAELEELQKALDSRPAEDQSQAMEVLNQERELLTQERDGYKTRLMESETFRQAMEGQLQELRLQLEAAEDARKSLEQQLAETEQARAAMEQHLAESQRARTALEQQCISLQERAQETPVAIPVPMEPVKPAAPRASELESYRRAQSIERESQIQAQLMYYQANGVLNEAAAKVDGIAEEITGLADQVMRELTQLQVAVSNSKHALQDASTMMRAIRPNV